MEAPTLEVLEHRKEWVKALRSGEYKQAAESLRVDDSYCCLGVACDLFKDETDGRWNDDGRFIFSNKQGQEDWISDQMPDCVSGLLGMSPEGLLVAKVKSCETLIGLNDDAGMSFPEIAQVIEDQFIKPYEVVLVPCDTCKEQIDRDADDTHSGSDKYWCDSCWVQCIKDSGGMRPDGEVDL